MTALNTFKFGEYFLRPANELDRALAEKWTAADPEHAGVIEPGFWLENRLGRDGFLLSDQRAPLYFFKMHIHGIYDLRLPDAAGTNGPVEMFESLHDAVQVFIQFPPFRDGRVMRGLTEGCKWLERTIAPMGARELFFDSKNESLIRFCVSRLGFTRDGNNLRKKLTI